MQRARQQVGLDTESGGGMCIVDDDVWRFGPHHGVDLIVTCRVARSLGCVSTFASVNVDDRRVCRRNLRRFLHIFHWKDRVLARLIFPSYRTRDDHRRHAVFNLLAIRFHVAAVPSSDHPHYCKAESTICLLSNCTAMAAQSGASRNIRCALNSPHVTSDGASNSLE